jgi:para-aminobenzoate synthetase
MRILLIDNYDSFTYNLVQYLAEVIGTPPAVLRNDDHAGLAALDLEAFDAVIVSPGPGSPVVRRDFGISWWAVQQDELPLLGVCLGHQGICLAAGARVDLAPEPVHGQISQVWHSGAELFEGIPAPFKAVRYHSLLAYDLPDSVVPLAATADGSLMAVCRRDRPHWGVQFHPESIGTGFGMRLLGNFGELARRHRGRSAPVGRARPALARKNPGTVPETVPPYSLRIRALAWAVDPEAAFEALFGDDPGAFWLDSSLVSDGLSRFSVLGGSTGPLAETVEYRLGSTTEPGEVVARRARDGAVSRTRETVFDYLSRKLAERRMPKHELPFDFALGYVGYLGYELKADCGGDVVHRSGLPDAQLVFCDRALVIDHREDQAWLLTLSSLDQPDASDWANEAEGMLVEVSTPGEPRYVPGSSNPPAVSARHSDGEYAELIALCQEQIVAGESYEICLTNTLTVPISIRPWLVYRALRRVNPAPYAAFLRYPDCTVLSSSPERFLWIDATGVVESKPIKGTRPRGSIPDADAALSAELRSSEKDRAENLMIVDLVRNDVGRVAETGSVCVPSLFAVESYATVHQLVSTVRARLRPEVTPLDCIRTAFPSGSMTGAPKLRTMEIIDRLEAGPRGIYSGAIGYLSLTGAVDLSVVIRTMVVTKHDVTIGVGGAITALSDPQEEINEMWTKAKALLTTLAAVTDTEPTAAVGALT